MKYGVWNRHTKRVLKHAAGWFCLAAGLIMLITPGQGILTMLLGVFLLADEIPFFGRIRDRLQQRFPKTAAYVHQLGERLKTRFHKESP